MLKDTLLYLAQNRTVRDFVIHNPLTREVSRRFVAGEELDEAIEATRVLNGDTFSVTLNHLGENVSDAEHAKAATQDYMLALDRIKQARVNATISIKLTALGLDISQELCEQHVRSILEHAERYASFVCIDMEGSAYTDCTVALTLRMHQYYQNVGTVIQSYLYRSGKDVEQLIAQGVRVRLVKGAYKESKEVAFQHKSEVDYQYDSLMKLLLSQGEYPAIASHDEAIINAACAFAGDNNISKSAFEFQMLYGIRLDLQEKLVRQGYNVRIYLPYGSQWYPYLMRRMAERPANLAFVLRNMVR